MSVSPFSPEAYRNILDEIDAVETEVLGEYEPSEDTTVPYSEVDDVPLEVTLENETFGTIPSEKPGALRLMDLEPGLEVVVHDERKEDTVVSKEVVLSAPTIEQVGNIGQMVLVDAMPYQDGGFGEPRRINLAIWGVAPNSDGYFNQKRWIEPAPSNN